VKLQDFISETLREILAGIREAQAFSAANGGAVMPAKVTFRTDQGLPMWDKTDGTPVQMIEFDVAVTTAEGTATKGGVGVFVGAVGLGSQGQSNASNQSVSRIKFSVPVIFPKQEKT
jgi:hypothetical protein